MGWMGSVRMGGRDGARARSLPCLVRDVSVCRSVVALNPRQLRSLMFVPLLGVIENRKGRIIRARKRVITRLREVIVGAEASVISSQFELMSGAMCKRVIVRLFDMVPRKDIAIFRSAISLLG